MRQTLMLILVATIATLPLGAQEDEADTASEVEETEVTPEAEEPEDTDEPIVDDEYYQDVDDQDFRPSEDIPADQSISFPSDI